MAGLRARAHLEAPLAVVAHVKAECGVELGLQGLRATVHAGTLLARWRLRARRWLRRETRGTATLEICHRLRRLIVETVILFVLVHLAWRPPAAVLASSRFLQYRSVL